MRDEGELEPAMWAIPLVEFISSFIPHPLLRYYWLKSKNNLGADQQEEDTCGVQS